VVQEKNIKIVAIQNMAKKSLFLNGLLSYLIIQIFGLLSAKKILNTPSIYQQIENQKITWEQFLISIIFITLLIFLILKFLKRKRPYKIFFNILFFFGCFYTLNIWLPAVVSFLISLLLIILYQKYKKIFFHNIIIALTIIWASALIGLIISYSQAILILLILSAYDIFAVFLTKHMIYLFKGLAEKEVVFALTIPINLKDLSQPMPKFNQNRVALNRKKFVFLGTGDIALPMIFSISLLKENFLLSISVILGTLFGLTFIYLFLIKREKRPLPALPPLALGAIFFWAIFNLFIK